MEINITILFQIAVFLVLLGWLSRFLFKPLLALIDERERRIVGARAEAQELLAAADERKKDIEVRIMAAQKAARSVLEELKSEGVAHHRKVLEEAQLQAHAQLKEGFALLAAEAKQVRAILFSEVDALSGMLLAKFAAKPSGSSGDSSSKMEFHSAS